MGLALSALSALSHPFHALAHWLQPVRGTSSRSAVQPAITARTCREYPVPGIGIAYQSKPPLQHPAILMSTVVRGRTASYSQGAASNALTLGASSRRGARRPVRVLHPASHSEVGRMVIAGRMADVCAELDRMAACEVPRH